MTDINVDEKIKEFSRDLDDVAKDMVNEMTKPLVTNTDAPSFAAGNAAAIRRVTDSIDYNIKRLISLAERVSDLTADLNLTLQAYEAALNVLTKPQQMPGDPQTVTINDLVVDSVPYEKLFINKKTTKRPTMPKASDGE